MATSVPTSRPGQRSATEDPVEALVHAALAQSAAPERWQVSVGDAPTDPWLHVTSSAWSAENVLQRVLPILLADDAGFKVARSLRDLDLLNEADGGLSQIGKFVTIYPNEDAQAVHLAVALGALTPRTARPDEVPA